jgi:hypothetical protein
MELGSVGEHPGPVTYYSSDGAIVEEVRISQASDAEFERDGIEAAQ